MVYISGAKKNRLGKHRFDAHFHPQQFRCLPSSIRISSGNNVKDEERGLYLDPRRGPFSRLLRCVADGSARDGGLYVPREWPHFSKKEIRALRGKSYQDIAFTILSPFTNGEIPADTFRAMIDEAYATFRHPAIAPLVQTGPNSFVMELFHGTTLAFKDVAMQLLARLMDYALEKRGERATIVGATSGDTGGAAIDAFAGRDRTDIFILFPHGKVSPVQQRQMTTSTAGNVHALAVKGNFDDCQNLVKAMFNDAAFRDKVRAFRRQLDQLGAHHGPDRLLLHDGDRARRAGP